MNNTKYSSLGVSSKKEEVRDAIKGVSSGIYLGAFCNAINNPFPWIKSEQDLLYLSHADGTGTKSCLAYLYWRETGDLSVFSDLMQDAMYMNTDDLLCVGVQDHFYFSSTIGRNKHYIPGEVIKALIKGQQRQVDFLQNLGVNCQIMGGETADIGDVVRTLVVDMTATSFLPKINFIDTANIKTDQIIVGLASYGRSSYELKYNSGIGSNGLTLARHELLNSRYLKNYPETFDDNNKNISYTGKYLVQDLLPEMEDSDENLNIGQALLSPTRTYLPIIRKIIGEKIPINAIIHLTGGGQSKSIKFGKNIHFIKDKLFSLPPIFKEISKTVDLKELFSVFNSGHRMEIYTDQRYTKEIIDISQSFSVPAKIIGRTESFKDSDNSNKNKLTLSYNGDSFVYY